MTGRVLFYVQHLLGIGHLKRASAISDAMVAEGLGVTIAFGGRPVPGVRFSGAGLHQLPPAGIFGRDFAILVDEEGRAVDEAWRRRRLADLLKLAEAVRPEILLFELFPFGRRQFRFELLPLLKRVRGWTPPPAVVASVRDILVRPSKPEREDETARLVRQAFDRVLVHGDPAFVPFEASFGPFAEIGDLVRYTGYVGPGSAVANGRPHRTEATTGEVIVSAGGGAVGAPLIAAALAARPRSGARDLPWRILTGPGLPEAAFREAEAAASAAGTAAPIVVERFRSDFAALLGGAALSISQAGYNTVMDLLVAGTPAILVPFAAGGESEQRERAKRLGERGFCHVVDEDDLSAETLAASIDRALKDAPRRRAMPAADFAIDGAATTARLIREMAEARCA